MDSTSANHIRNILFLFLGAFFGLEFCFYLSGVLFILMVWGPDYLDFNTINPSFHDFPDRIWPTIFTYVEHWWHNPSSYDAILLSKLGVSLIIPIGILSTILWNLRNILFDWRPFKKKESLHGDSRWATEKDIRKIGLRSRKGILLGKDKRGYLIADGFQHALLFAPTGSGKGVGFVIPNLLFWEDSVVVHDIKLENYELTSGWRKKRGQEVFVWNPAQPDGISHCYNPLDWISSKPGQMVDDVQKIANLIMPEQDFWYNEARSLFVGVVLYLLAVPEKVKSFGEVVRTMRSDDVVYNLAVVLDTIGKKIHPVAYMNIAAFLQKADKERSGVVSTMNSSLELWANPLIDTATASSDFNIQDFKRKKVTVYVGLTPDNLTRLRPLMQVFYQQATEFLCRTLPSDDEPYGVLFLMDEFPTLGKMEQFQTGIAYFRGYRVRLFLIIQDTEQLKGIYEEAGMNSFLSNSTYRITFAANNIETANLISQLIGNKTVNQESLNRPKFLDLNPASRSLHISETQRALLLPQEVIMLPRDEQILLIESTYPIKSKKIKYFEDKNFTKKLLKSTFVPTQEPYDPNNVKPTYKENENTIPSLESSIPDNTNDSQENAMYESVEESDNYDDDDFDFDDLDEYTDEDYNHDFDDDDHESQDDMYDHQLDEYEDDEIEDEEKIEEDIDDSDQYQNAHYYEYENNNENGTDQNEDQYENEDNNNTDMHIDEETDTEDADYYDDATADDALDQNEYHNQDYEEEKHNNNNKQESDYHHENNDIQDDKEQDDNPPKKRKYSRKKNPS
ncbi:type IV secretion system protein VirD4 [Ehrlichia ruminantium]|uniref:Type IV secretion system protein VirD4 n=1 Tax=Ehrlichia ruminantium TaxID=779 RepID=A0AAE6QCD3_EHRRU|nr:type IV secretory system conjugative DNA transfer family protein [Ehrlichia ruminantium]QGR02115.1 type IV secretion system protein VirD4 [Ehrlichia ruminantium]QGR03035.1 type IV secretion system protein VirD4 [Ehrlichia ruminantium]QGR03960.1 type IV secretion system protein VirD4 [Ehrlichia ruminantium]